MLTLNGVIYSASTRWGFGFFFFFFLFCGFGGGGFKYADSTFEILSEIVSPPYDFPRLVGIADVNMTFLSNVSVT